MTLCMLPCDGVTAASIKVKAGKECAKIIQIYLNAYSLASQGRYDDYDRIGNVEKTYASDIIK